MILDLHLYSYENDAPLDTERKKGIENQICTVTNERLDQESIVCESNIKKNNSVGSFPVIL